MTAGLSDHRNIAVENYFDLFKHMYSFDLIIQDNQNLSTLNIDNCMLVSTQKYSHF